MGNQNQDFCDYYSILQVHQNAEPEIIKSAYRRLAQMYHPDYDPDPRATSKMQLINRAYEVVSDPGQRRIFHSEWLRHYQKQEAPRSTYKADPDHAAQQALDSYFRCLLQEDFIDAYKMLTAKDRRKVSLTDFCQWKEAVKTLCQMGSYVIKPFRSYDNCTVDETEYKRVCIYSVFVTDQDKRTKHVNEETYTKHVVLDQDCWRICLGYSEVKTITYKLKYLATQAPEMDPSLVYVDTLLKYDKLTGFLSYRGLRECAEKEIARAKRFRNHFCIAVFSIRPAGQLSNITESEYMNMCLSNFACELKKTLRSIDHAARISDTQLAVLLIETHMFNASKAAARIIRSIRQGDGLQYGLESSITAYQGESAEDILIRSLHDASMKVTIENDHSKKYHININGQV